MNTIRITLSNDLQPAARARRAGAAATRVRIGLFCAALLATAAFEAGAVPFMSKPITVPTGGSPARVRLADVDGDGRPDLIVTNNGANTVSVHLNVGGGNFGGPTAYPVGAGPTDVIVLDVNNDGKPDLIVLNTGGNSVSVLINNGNGTFKPAVTYPVGANPTQLDTIVAANNTVRIATVNTGGNSISYMVGAANGTFGAATTFPVGAAPVDLIRVDLDGDGVAEYVVANSGDKTISVITRGGPGGTPTSATTWPVGDTPTRLAHGDLNGDGKQDIVVTNAGSNSLTVLFGVGDKTFAHITDFGVGASPRGIINPLQDLNGDGTPDVVIRNADSSITVILVPPGLVGSPTVTTYPAGPAGTGFGFNYADFDGDGISDIIAVNAADGKWYVLPGLGNGSFAPTRSYAAGAAPGSRYAFTDVDGDGNADVAFPNASANNVTVLLARAAPPVLGTVTEFYNTILDNYFITADPNEAAAIDNGSAGPGWIRTGATYNFNSGGNTYVCRFYGSLSPGPNSHFYTALPSECEGLKQLAAQTPPSVPRWNFESLDFVSTLPALGNCPAGTVPVYRAFNNGPARGKDANHRITKNRAGIDEVVARGWIDESVQMCAPQ